LAPSVSGRCPGLHGQPEADARESIPALLREARAHGRAQRLDMTAAMSTGLVVVCAVILAAQWWSMRG